MRKEKDSPQKKKLHEERECLTGKENVSRQKKISHNETRKKLKMIVINKTIYTDLLQE